MTEALFQHLWQHGLFRPEGLKTTSGEDLTVIHPGRINTDAGPDFKEGKIKIGNTTWVGNIELHIKSSDWQKHQHEADPLYQNIILHVVLEDDINKDLGNFPTLVLKPNLYSWAIERYQKLMDSPKVIPCQDQIAQFPSLPWQAWLNRLLAERWEQKLLDWTDLWEQSGKDWRQLFYYRLAANFGFHVNQTPFLMLAQSIPLKVLATHRSRLIQIEALLFGQSGMLSVAEGADPYLTQLRQEYHFLRRKYDLESIPVYHWKFLRMRPANFPTIRIAQFAALIHRQMNLFSKMMDLHSEKEVQQLLEVTASSYWDQHYRFGVPTQQRQAKRLGQAAIRNLIINTVAPMQFLYAQLQGSPELIEKSVDLLASMKAENNKIIQQWEQIGKPPKNAAESQALLQLFNQYCQEKRCLSCAVGHYLIGKK